MNLKVQGAWEAGKLINLLRADLSLDKTNSWLNDLLTRFESQYEKELERRRVGRQKEQLK